MEALALKTAADPAFRREFAERTCTLGNPNAFYSCLTCGMCACGCVYSDVHENMDPREFVRKVALGLREQVLNDPFIWACTACARCTMNCPMGISVAEMVRTARGKFGLTGPGDLQTVANDHLRCGNQMCVTEEDFFDTIEWMAEELSAELGKEIKIPVDVEGADILFVAHPREIKYYPQDIQSWTKIFWAAGISWTLSSKAFDVTNFGLFNGRDDEAEKIMRFTHNEMKRLKCKRLVMTECGHGFWAYVWGAKVWLKGEVDYPVIHMVELLAELIREGKIKVDPSKNPEPITLHDPCNIVRKAKVIEPQRYVLSQVCQNFVEMWPNREYNYCCGGGGGALAMGDEIRKLRMLKGKLKIEQIERTGAKLVCAPCHNCADQLTDIFKYYKTDLKHVHLHHLVANALVLE